VGKFRNLYSEIHNLSAKIRCQPFTIDGINPNSGTVIVCILQQRALSTQNPRTLTWRFHDFADGANALPYAHCANLTLGSSNALVAISASQRVTGKMIKCGARKLKSRPSGPALDIGNLFTHSGRPVAWDSLDQPVAA
jgi:hypothetical protein